MVFRLLLTRRREEQLIHVQAQVHTVPQHGWLTVDEWQQPAPRRFTARERDITIREACASHGWQSTGAIDDHGDHTISVDVRPIDWRHLLATATARRAARKAAYEAADVAWQTIVADTPRQGEPGYVGAIEIADLAGMTRYRIYQIQGVGKKPGVKTRTDPPTTHADPD